MSVQGVPLQQTNDFSGYFVDDGNCFNNLPKELIEKIVSELMNKDHYNDFIALCLTSRSFNHFVGKNLSNIYRIFLNKNMSNFSSNMVNPELADNVTPSELLDRLRSIKSIEEKCSEDQAYTTLAGRGHYTLGSVSPSEGSLPLNSQGREMSDKVFVWNLLNREIKGDGTEVGVDKLSNFENWCEAHKEDLAKLTELSFPNSNIMFFPEVTHLSHLETFVLSTQMVMPKFFPTAVCSMITLTKLVFTNSEAPFLPKEIGQLTKLTFLDVSSNNFTRIPETIGGLTSLECFKASYNKIVALPDSICNLTNLEVLKLGANNIESLPDSIGDLTKLKELNLASNRISSLPKSFQKILDSKSVKKLCLEDNKVTEQELLAGLEK